MSQLKLSFERKTQMGIIINNKCLLLFSCVPMRMGDELAKFCVPVGRLVLPGLKIEIFLIVMHIAIFVRCNMGENFYLRTGLVCVLSLYQKGSHALVCHLITTRKYYVMISIKSTRQMFSKFCNFHFLALFQEKQILDIRNTSPFFSCKGTVPATMGFGVSTFYGSFENIPNIPLIYTQNTRWTNLA